MVKVDRPTWLESLDVRHESLLEQLEALNSQIEAALAACGVSPEKPQGCEQRLA